MENAAEAELELLVAAAVMYYEQNRSQQAIARRLGVSRSTVSRFLGRAKELGVVRIQVEPPNQDPEIARQLADQLGLRAVHIAQGRAQDSEPGPILAEPLATALEETRLSPGDVALASWGRAVASAIRHLRSSDTGAIVAPATGGYASDELWLQPNEIVRLLALALNGHPRFLNAPAVVSPGLAQALQVDAHTRSVVALWDRAKVALVAVGAWPKPDPGYTAAGFPVDDPALNDAVGDIAGIPFTAEGDLVAWPPHRQLLGVTAEQLRRIPYVIGLAGGVPAARAAVGAARAGLITVLVTDAPTARAIVAMADQAVAPA
jgi:DNA-binding transcriptional regulator LsrR (DeoR family)